MLNSDMNKLKVAVIEGTTREKRMSIHAARLIEKIGREYEDLEIIFVDPKDFNFPGDGNDPEGKDPKYTKITAEADAFFIVTPEYNHSFPGSLKRLLDSELKNYKHKPVAFAGVSVGPFGGARAIESLVNAVREMGLIATFTDVHFGGIGKIFDKKGNLQDDAFNDRIKKSFDELIWMAKSLKWGRDNLDK